MRIMSKEVKFLWENWNNNPYYKEGTKYDFGDCVIRAICKAKGLDWFEVYDLLAAKGRQMGSFGNWKEVYEAVLKDLGFYWVSCPRTKGVKAMDVETFIKKHEAGAYILRLAHHLTAVVGGCCYDTWYPQHSTVYGYWMA